MDKAAGQVSEIRTAPHSLAARGADLVSDKTALITGYSGQDGTFLTEHLLKQGYEVIGIGRRISTEPPLRVRGKFDFSEQIKSGQLILCEADLLSVDSLIKVVQAHKPTEVYNLAAQSHVAVSFKQPELTAEINYLGVINLITALEASYDDWKLYQASTSEMFGHDINNRTLKEDSPLDPISPYAIAKAAAHQYCKMKRGQGRFISCGILFNHESEIRGGDFVTQKIARGIKHWQSSGDPIELGNLDSSRDWGYAGDYVKAMQLILSQTFPGDYVVATGETHTIRQFVEAGFKAVNQQVEWTGNEGWVNNKLAIRVNPMFYRPNEVGYLKGDPSAIRKLGWQPSVNFEQLVKLMVKAA